MPVVEGRRPEGGWCGESSIQMAMLYNGAYVSQRDINRAGKPRHEDLYSNEVPVAMTNLYLQYERWNGRGVAPFIKWLQSQLKQGRPILAGAKIYPTSHPEWGLDHFILVIGYTKDKLVYNTTWSRQESKSFSDLSAKGKGISFKSQYPGNYGYAITGMKSRSKLPQLPVRVQILSRKDKKVQLRVVIEGLSKGTKYRLLRFKTIQAAYRFDTASASVESIVAEGATWQKDATIGIDNVCIFRCIKE